MKYKRIFLIVLDSVGAGEAPDAKDYGDEGSNTLRAISKSDKFKINALKRLGLTNIDGIDMGQKENDVIGKYGKLTEKSKGKDTTTGHWEMAGIISEKPFPTYPNGFPEEIIKEFEGKIGRKVLCNMPYSGTEVIKDYGREHIETGGLIVYTSADSVFQIAAHEDVVPLDDLYNYCRIAREILQGEHAVGRVIARPFIGEYPNYLRTSNRHDFSLEVPRDTMLNYLQKNNYDVIAIGKINDIFAGSGITEKHYTKGNAHGMDETIDALNKDFTGLCFTNLVDFDMIYGHRNDLDGYAAALTEFDVWLSGFMGKINNDDLIIITADHGCDPSTPSTDHSREYTPLIVYSPNIEPENLGIRKTFSDIGKTVLFNFGIENDLPGEIFAIE